MLPMVYMVIPLLLWLDQDYRIQRLLLIDATNLSRSFERLGCGSGRKPKGMEWSVRMDNGIQVIWPSSNQLGGQRVRRRRRRRRRPRLLFPFSLVASMPRHASGCTHVSHNAVVEQKKTSFLQPLEGGWYSFILLLSMSKFAMRETGNYRCVKKVEE